MPFHFHLAAWIQAALLILYFYLHGYWITALSFPSRRDRNWAVMPVLGALIQGIALAHLSYAGLSIQASVWPVLLASLGLNVWAWNKTRFPGFYGEWQTLLIGGGGAALFLLPYVLYNSYPFIGDSFMYDGISDFLLQHGSFASAEPAHVYPWLTMMRYAQQVHLALGASVTQAAAASLLGQPSPAVFMPVTAAFLYVSLCGLRLLLTGRLAWAGLLLYATNVPLVLTPPALNLLRQVAGTGYLFALVAVALEKPSRWQIALFLAGLVTFYPELLPFALAPLAVYLVWERTWGRSVRVWLEGFALGLLLNLYGWYSAVQNVLFHWNAKPGFVVTATGLDYVKMLAGMGDHVWAAVAVAATAVWGFWQLDRARKVYTGAGILIFGAVASYLWIGPHYTYGVYKNVLFGYFLIVLCVSSAFHSRWGGAALAVWMAAVAFPVSDFVLTGYGILRDGAYQELRGPGRMLGLFSPLQSLDVKGRTLIAIADEQIAKWTVYYFRQASGLYFPGEYLPIARERPLKSDERDFQQILVRTADTSLADDERALWRNPILTLSAAQTFVTFGQTGWLARSVGIESASRVMGAKAELVAYSPAPARIELIGVSAASCHIAINGKPAGESINGFWRSPAIPLAAGFTVLWLTTDCAPMRWESLTLVKPLRGQVNLADAGARQSLAGLTEDGWVLKQGVRLEAGTSTKMQLAGETLAAPQTLRLTGGGRTETVVLTQKGRFDITVELPGHDVILAPDKLQQAGSGDPRQLGIRLTQVLAW